MFLFRQIKNNIHMSVSTKDVITSINLNVTVSSRLNLHIIFWSIIIRGFNVLFMLGQLIWFHLTSISPWHQKETYLKSQAMVLEAQVFYIKQRKSQWCLSLMSSQRPDELSHSPPVSKLNWSFQTSPKNDIISCLLPTWSCSMHLKRD